MNKHPNQSGLNRGGPHGYQKGVSGNPAGRPKKDVSLTSLLKVELERVADPTLLKKELNEIAKGEPTTKTWRELLVQSWLYNALKNPLMLKEILDRLEGRPSQAMELTGAKGGPIETKAVIFGSDTIQSALECLVERGAVKVHEN